jgi:Protein of unknown function (DUF2786)
MGVRNKQRRREKAKRRAEQARRRESRAWSRDDATGPSRHQENGSSVRRIREALWAAAGMHRERPACTQADVDVLVSADFERVAAEAEQQLLWLVGLAWQRGWQPSELVRHARQGDRRLGRVIGALIGADDERRDSSTVHPKWSEQVHTLEIDHVARVGWLHDLVEQETPVRCDQLHLVVSAMVLLATLGTLPTILPPPGTDPSTWNRRDDTPTDIPVLAKVRALLAQAESTTYEAEAEAFTAKAQELMARHAIDSALLWARTDRGARPMTIRLPMDDPYASQKAHLLHVVSRNSRCKAVRHADYGLVSVVGFAPDVAATEVLFTSLLVQSHAAMLAEAANAPPGSHSRGRSFRSSFLFAYACRIDKRLAEVNQAVESEAAEAEAAEGRGSRLLPVLAARADAIDEEVAATFGKLTKSPVQRSYDALGWDRGVLAADRAQLRPDLPAAGT